MLKYTVSKTRHQRSSELSKPAITSAAFTGYNLWAVPFPILNDCLYSGSFRQMIKCFLTEIGLPTGLFTTPVDTAEKYAISCIRNRGVSFQFSVLN